MFRFVEVRPYEARRGHRFVFEAERDLFLRGDDGHLVFVPKGKRVEASLIDLSPCPGGLEAAVVYGGAFIALRRGLTLTAEEALSETLLAKAEALLDEMGTHGDTFDPTRSFEEEGVEVDWYHYD